MSEDSYDFLGPPPVPPVDPPPPGKKLRPVAMKPGEKLPDLDPSEEMLLLTPTATVAAFVLNQVKGPKDGPRLSISAASPLYGDRRHDCGLLLEGCERFALASVECSRASHGLRLRGCREFTVAKVRSHHNTIEGVIIGGCHDGEISDTDSFENGKTDKGHAFYLASFGSTGIIGRRLRAWNCKGCAFQMNGTPDELGPRKQKHILLENFVAKKCGSIGTPAINVMSTEGIAFRNGLIEGCNAGIALFDDYTDGADPWDVRIERVTMNLPVGKYGLQVSRGTRKVSATDSIFACQPGPVREFVASEVMAGAAKGGGDLKYLVAVPDEAALEAAPETRGQVLWFGLRGSEEWSARERALDPMTLQSRIAGVGWTPW